MVQRLANFWVQKRGYSVWIVCLEPSPVAYDLDPTIRKTTLRSGVFNHGFGKILALPLQAYELSRIIQRVRPDLVFSVQIRSNLVHLLTTWFGNKRPVVISERTLPRQRYSSMGLQGRIMLWLIRKLYPKADAIIAISNGVKDDLISLRVDPNKIHVIYNPLLISAGLTYTQPPQIPWSERRSTIVTVGRLVPSKDHALLLEAFAKVREKLDSKLIIVGDGPERSRLEKLARDLGIDDDVWFTGWRQDPHSIMSRCDVFVMTSRYEGFGNVIVEAMACGLPVISTDCPGGPREILQGGDAGLLVPVGDVQKLAQSIIEILTDSQLRNRYAEKSIRRVRDFDIERIADQYIGVMLKVFCSVGNTTTQIDRIY